MKLSKNKFLSFVGLVLKDYPFHFMAMVFFILLSLICELVGLATLLPVINIFVAGENSIGSKYVYMDRFFSVFNVTPTLGVLCAFLVLVFILKGIFMYLSEYNKSKIRVLTNMDMREGIYKRIFKADWSFFMAKKVGDLSNITNTQTRNAAGGIAHLAQFISSAVFVAAFVVVSLTISWQMVLLCFVIGVGVYLSINFVFKQANIFGRRIGQNENRLNQVIITSFTSPKKIKGSVLEDHYISWFSKIVEEARKIEIGYARITSFLVSFSEPIGAIIGISMLFIAVTYLNQPLEKIVVLVLIFYRMSQKVGTFPRDYAGVMHYLPLYQMCRNLRDEAGKAKEVTGVEKVDTFRKEIALSDVSFGYKKDQKVLRNINLVIRRGEFLGITGRSGGGKTTLVDTIVGLLHQQEGDILIDGKNIRDIDIYSWRNKIGYVGQDSPLCNISVIDNITLGCPKIDRMKVEEAARMAHAHEFIVELPQGYDTVIGERGLTLSGGQRQRIAMAQALYGDPEILILDEATSSLDGESELMIKRSVDELYGEITIIAIAHRLKTIENADRIIVLEDGRIIEEGKKEDLIRLGGAFKSLIDAGNILV
jgi:ATP-binding cassette, subfamily B, bacterial MsbA